MNYGCRFETAPVEFRLDLYIEFLLKISTHTKILQKYKAFFQSILLERNIFEFYFILKNFQSVSLYAKLDMISFK